MKKFFLVVLIVVICCCSAGCGGTANGGAEISSNNTSSKHASSKMMSSVDSSNEVAYISDRDVDYYKADKKHTVFFGLKNASETYISSSGKADITIYDSDDKKVYSKSIKFSSKDFSSWSSAQWNGSKYLCGLDIQQKNIPHCASSSGVLALKVTLDDGTWFDEKRISMYDLPEHEWNAATCTSAKKCKTCGKTSGSPNEHSYNSDGKCYKCGQLDPTIEEVLSRCSLEVPSLPEHISYKTYSRDDLISSVEVTNITYKFEYSKYSEAIELNVYFSGTRTYHENGKGQSAPAKIGWKIYDENDNVIETGTFDSPSVAEGESFANKEETVIYSHMGVAPGAFRLEILDVN